MLLRAVSGQTDAVKLARIGGGVRIGELTYTLPSGLPVHEHQGWSSHCTLRPGTPTLPDLRGGLILSLVMLVLPMIAKVSVKGQTVIPEAIREQARIKPGDQLEVGYANGLIVMRKRKPLTPARIRSLILAGRELPEMTSADEAAVARATETVRRRRR